MEIATTLVLVGRTGNGKSATGNSILGRRAFESSNIYFGVTATCQLEQVQLKDGRKLNVIDTPGLYDRNLKLDVRGPEILKCIDLAKDGLHGVLLVLSFRNRFPTEEAAILKTLQMLFGEKISNYMVVIFTGVDELEDSKQRSEEYFRDGKPALQEILRQCNSRNVIFDNRTRDPTVMEKQRSELLKQVDIVIAQNGGHPYSNEMFLEAQEFRKHIDSGGYWKEQIQILQKKMEKELVEEKQRLAAEQTTREQAKRDLPEKISMFEENFEQRLAVEQFAPEQAERNSREKVCMVEDKFEQRLAAEQSAGEHAERDSCEKIRMLEEKFEHQLAAEQSAREQAERDSRETIHMLQEKFEQRLAAEQSAREQAERDSRENIHMLQEKFEQRLAAEQSAREQVERDSHENIHMLQEKFEQRLAAEQSAREQAERDSREKLCLLQENIGQRLKAEQSAREQAERDSGEKICILEEKFEQRLAAEHSAREQAEKDSNEKICMLEEKLEDKLGLPKLHPGTCVIL